MTKNINFAKKNDMSKENFDPHIPVNNEETKEAIEYIINASEDDGGEVKRRIISKITERQINDLEKEGFDMDESWVHSIETSAVVHAKRRHGSKKLRHKEGHIAINDDDIRKIPEILSNYDRLYKSPNAKKSGSNPVIVYEKIYEDGTIYYIEEKRDGRKSLAFQTMYKKN